jgi:ribosome-associated translation inhibitor RaiA
MSEISFVGLEPSDALRDYAQRKISTLVDPEQTFSSRVVLEADRHSHTGNRFRAKFELAVRGTTIVTGARGVPFADMYAAIDAAYDEAKRVLRERSARRDDRRRV